MTILGIETSTSVCSVGLANDIGRRSEKSLIESHIHSEKLLTLIQDLCDEQKMSLSQVDGVAVSIGPGSFTGLRIGLSAAKGLCVALEKPLIPVPTFISISNCVFLLHPEYARVIVCIDAKQREYYIGVYERTNGTVREVLEVQMGSLSTALTSVSSNSVIVTDRRDNLKTDAGNSIMVQDVLSYCRGDMIAQLAMEQSVTIGKNNWKQLEPTYLKDFVIRTQVKKIK